MDGGDGRRRERRQGLLGRQHRVVVDGGLFRRRARRLELGDVRARGERPRPAPRSTSTRTPSMASASASSAGSRENMANVTALSRSGRLMVSVATGPSRCSRSDSVADSLGATGCVVTEARLRWQNARPGARRGRRRRRSGRRSRRRSARVRASTAVVCWPSQGAGRSYAPVRDRLNLAGWPSVRTRPISGCSISTIISRAVTCGSARASSWRRTGPAGTPAASSTASQCAVPRVLVTASISASSSSMCSIRAAGPANLGSSSQRAAPSASAVRRQSRSLPARS